MSYSSPKTKRFTKIGSKPAEKTDSPKKSTKRKRESLKLNPSTVPGRVRELRARSPARTTLSFTIQNRDSDVDGFSITAYLPQSGWKKLKLQATPGMTVQQVVETELPEVGQFAYQVYQFPSRALLNPERDATVLRDQEISIEPMMSSSLNNMQEDPRLAIVKELLASEDNYLENLKSIFDTYAEPLRSWGVGPGDMKILFESVGQLCDILMNFFSELEIAVLHWCPWTTRIGGLFKKYSTFWSLYEDYSTKYPNAIKLLRWKQDNDPAFVNFLQKKRGAARHTLESLMLLPVHRVWEYDRLLSQLILFTPDSHPDHPDLHSTVEKVHLMVQSREDYLNYSENVSRIAQVQSRFPSENLYLTEPIDVLHAYAVKAPRKSQVVGSVSPSSSRGVQAKILSCVPIHGMDVADSPSMINKRKSARLYIQEGPVSMISMGALQQQDRYMFLFDDLLLIAKPSGKHKQGKTFKLKHRVRVSEMWVSESVEEVTDVSIPLDTSFVFGWPTYNHIAVFSTTGERELWKGLFLKHIEAQQQLLEPKSLYINIINELDGAGIGPPDMLEVDYNETVRDVIAKALEIFRITEDVGYFQLWVKQSRHDEPYPLIGHEFPYAIQLSNARNSDQGMDHSHLQFVIRRRQRSMDSSSTESTPHHHAHSRRTNFRKTFKGLNWNKWTRKRETIRQSKIKFFGTSLQQIMPDGRMPRVLQALLIRMYIDGPVTHGILRKSANAQKVRELKSSIDNGQKVDLDAAATHVIAALFKEFLRNIPGGLLPSSRYTVLVASNDCKDIDDRALLITRVIEKFPEENKVLVQHVIPLLHHISRFNSVNAMPTTNIAICLAPTLLWPDTGLDVIMNEVPPLVQFLIEHSPKIFGPDLPELFENLPPPASDCDPSTTDNTPPVTLVPTKREDGSKKSNRMPISISSEESLQSQGDTSLSDDSLGDNQVHSDSTLYENEVTLRKKSKHIAQGGRGSVLLSGQSIASLHQETDDDEDDLLPLPVAVPDEDQMSDDDTLGVASSKSLATHWRYRERMSRSRHTKRPEEATRRRSHIGVQHEPLTLTPSISPSGSQSSSSPSLSPKATYPMEDGSSGKSLRDKRVQSDTVLTDDVPRRRNKRTANAPSNRPVGIIEVQQHSGPYSSSSYITTGPVAVTTERYRSVQAQFPSTFSVDSLKSSSSEERSRAGYSKDKYTASGSPGTERSNFRKRLEINDRGVAINDQFPISKRRSFRETKVKRARKAARSQSMKESYRPESVIVNVHYHTTSSSYDDLTMFKRANGDHAAPVQAGEGPTDDFREQSTYNNVINKPASYQPKEINRSHPLNKLTAQQNTSPRSSRVLPDSDETKMKMVSTLKQKAIAKLARTATHSSPTENTSFAGYQRRSVSGGSPVEVRAPVTHRYNSVKSSSGNIEPCRITRRYGGQLTTRSEPKRKSFADASVEEKREMHKEWKSQAPTMADKKKAWEGIIKATDRRPRADSDGSNLKAELEAARQKLEQSKLETAREESATKKQQQQQQLIHQVSKFVTTAKPRMPIRQVIVKTYHVSEKSKPRKIIYYAPSKRIVEVRK